MIQRYYNIRCQGNKDEVKFHIHSHLKKSWKQAIVSPQFLIIQFHLFKKDTKKALWQGLYYYYVGCDLCLIRYRVKEPVDKCMFSMLHVCKV